MRLVSKSGVTVAFVAATLLGCGASDMARPESSQLVATLDLRTNPALFSPDASPYGTSMERWGELAWKWTVVGVQRPPSSVEAITSAQTRSTSSRAWCLSLAETSTHGASGRWVWSSISSIASS